MCLLHVYYIHSGNKTIFICLKHGTGWMDALPSLPLTGYHLLHNKIFSFSVQHKPLLKRLKSCISVSFQIPSERAPCFKRRKSQQHAPGVAFQATKTEIRRKEVVPGLWAKSQELIISKNKVRGLCLNFSSNFILALQEHFPTIKQSFISRNRTARGGSLYISGVYIFGLQAVTPNPDQGVIPCICSRAHSSSNPIFYATSTRNT